jgi:hypothetical protein
MFIVQSKNICKGISYLFAMAVRQPAKLMFISLQYKHVDCKVSQNLLNLIKGFWEEKIRAISSAGRAADS